MYFEGDSVGWNCRPICWTSTMFTNRLFCRHV